VKKLLTYEAPALEPKPKRKRVEDPHGLFKMAGAILRIAATRNPRAWFKDARQALRRVVLPRNHPANFTWGLGPDYAHEERLRLLERNNTTVSPQHDSGGFHYVETNTVAPQL
jgi:hypothetical protein